MIALALSIFCSVGVSVLLKVAGRRGVDVAQAIAVNYAVAAALAWLLLNPQLGALATPGPIWGVVAALGVLLPTIFLAMAGAVKHAGIVRSDAAQRLSLFIPVMAAFVLFGETVTYARLAGLTLAFAAMACLVGRYRPGLKDTGATGEGGDTAGPRGWMYLLAVWVGYGTIDILFKQFARAGTSFAAALFATFVLAGILLAGWLLLRATRWNRRSVLGGLALGLLNFGNILFYIRAHQHFSASPTLVFASMNIGVVALGTLVGAALFRERLNLRHMAGVVLAVAAIVVMIPR